MKRLISGKSVFRHARQARWLEKLPGIEICLTRPDHSAALRSWLRRKWDSRVLTQTQLDMDIKFWERSTCPDGPSSCLIPDNRETNAEAEQSSILPGFICRRAAKTNSSRCVMMWHGETTGKFQMWQAGLGGAGWGVGRCSRSSVTRSFLDRMD